MTQVPIIGKVHEVERRSVLARMFDQMDFVDVLLAVVVVIGLLGGISLLILGRDLGFIGSVITLALGFLIGRNAAWGFADESEDETKSHPES